MRALIWNAASIVIATLLLAVSCTSGSDPSNAESPQGTTEDGAATRIVPTNAVNEIDPNRTDYFNVSQSETSTLEAAPGCSYESDNRLIIGGLLPQTGKLDYLEPAQQAAIQLALDDIDRAEGVTGRDVIYLPGDSGSSGSTLVAAQRHLEEGADVIFGPPSSVLSKQVTSEITGSCRIQISSANTAAGFTPLEQNQLYFRTAASDELQGQALSDIVARSAATNVSIIAEDGLYGQALAAFTTTALGNANIEVAQTVYDPTAVDFNAAADSATATSPDAIVLIGFEESSQILKELLRRGITTDKIYLSDGNAGNALGEKFTAPNELDGIRGVLPGAEAPSPFKRRLNQLDEDIVDYSFSPETYDAIVIVALAAELAQSDAAPEIAKRINGVTSGGARCSSFAQCKKLINGGETDIDYNGISGPLSFSSNGEPTEATFAVVEFG